VATVAVDKPAGRLAPAGRARRLGDEPGWRWAALSPAVLLMLALALLPLANMGALSFHDESWADGEATWTPVGLDNYAALGDDALLGAGVLNTVIFAVAAVTVQMVLGFALALLCTKIGRGRTLYRALFMLPILIPGIVVGAMWRLLYNFDFGFINQAFGVLGFGPHDWLGSPETALMSVIIVDIWHWTPFCFLLMLAALESLPQDIYEAAKIDGASGWQELVRLTLPLMAPAIMVTLVFRIIVAFKVFDEVYLLTAGGPGTATEVVSFTIYRRFFTEDRVGYGSAMSILVIFAISLLLVMAMSARRSRGAGA
jgi:multiple sugar transport system permease protein